MAPSAPPEPEPGWARRGTAGEYLITGSVHCECCGRMIVRDAWITTIERTEHMFCDPSCEQLYQAHWLPRHGRTHR